ncbi:hypothetical protein APED_31260 [Acanthopleuribacter pedis]
MMVARLAFYLVGAADSAEVSFAWLGIRYFYWHGLVFGISIGMAWYSVFLRMRG